MVADRKIDELRRQTNPLFNDRKLKLGTFWHQSRLRLRHLDHRRHAGHQLAEHAGARPHAPTRWSSRRSCRSARWRGFGGKHQFQRRRASRPSPGRPGIGARDQIFRACSPPRTSPTMHPIMAAKQATTIDHITGGRFALNIVTGWNRPEIEMFGSPLLEHDDRYDMRGRVARHHQAAVDRGRGVRLRGHASTRSRRAILQPKPIQRPYPGDDERGRLAEGAALRRQVLRHGLRRHSARTTSTPARPGSTPIASSRARSTAARSRSGATPTWCRARPRRRRSDFCDEYVEREGRLGRRREPGQHHGAQRARPSRPRCCSEMKTPLHRRLGRLSDHRHQGADRRRPCSPCRRRSASTASLLDLAALRSRHARVQGEDAIRW